MEAVVGAAVGSGVADACVGVGALGALDAGWASGAPPPHARMAAADSASAAAIMERLKFSLIVLRMPPIGHGACYFS